MTDQPVCPPPPERRQLVRYRGRTRRPKARLTHQLVAAGLVDPRHVGRWPKARKTTTTTRYIHQGETMQPTMTPDDDRPTTIEMCLIPRIPKDLTAEQATALLAEIWGNGALPDHAKAKLAQQIDARLAEAAGKGPQPRAVVAGVFFTGAQPDEVQRQLKALAAHR